jgi:hypothetical protein
MILTQTMDVEIRVCGMITLENGDSTLASGQTLEQDPEFWDILVSVQDWGVADSKILLDIENIETGEELEKVLNDLAVFFPHASHENL